MIRVLEANFRALPVKTRMPFRYGIAVLTQVPHFFLELQIEINKQVYKGLAADNLPPKWFVKNPDESFSQELDNMLAVISHACESVTKLEPQTNIFAIWKACYEAQKSWGQAAKHPPLLWQFGVSLVERALIEAFCQAKNRSFANALRSNAFGLNLAYFHSSLKGKHPSEILPENPLVKLHARHTVGLSDPLTDNEILEEDRAKDSLPQSLDATLRHYGIHYLKLKLSGNSEADFNRLESIANLLKALDKEFVFTLDGNEQYSTLSSFKDFWQDLTKKSSMKSFLKRLLFVEQPFSRTIALSENLTRELLEWQDRPAIIIDESDAELGSLARALAGGYMGTSHKNCKGIFKSIANLALLKQKRLEQPEKIFIMSAEDLTNIGPVALQQDLAVLASLGINHAERNGHHYFKGLSMYPDALQKNILEHHPDLYTIHDDFVSLKIQEGDLDLRSVVNTPFGVGFNLNTSVFKSLTDVLELYKN